MFTYFSSSRADNGDSRDETERLEIIIVLAKGNEDADLIFYSKENQPLCDRV